MKYDRREAVKSRRGSGLTGGAFCSVRAGVWGRLSHQQAGICTHVPLLALNFYTKLLRLITLNTNNDFCH